MRRHGPYILLCLVLIGAVAGMGFSLSKVETLSPTGTWKDVEDDYYIVFHDSTYVESTYNVERPYEVVEGGLYLYDAAGEPYFVSIRPAMGGRVSLYLNGERRLMRRATSREAANPLLYSWTADVKGKCINAYALKQSLDKEYYLRMYDDFVFASVLGDEVTIGKYARNARGDILLLTDKGARVDQLKQWDGGAVFGQIGADMKAEVQKANMVDDLGYLFAGSCYDEETGTTYKFDRTGTCYRAQPDGATTEFLYFADMTGLITLTDAAGSGAMDYLWYDAVNDSVYRYVLGTDEWFAYLNGEGSSGVFSKVPEATPQGPDDVAPRPLIPEDSSAGVTPQKGVA